MQGSVGATPPQTNGVPQSAEDALAQALARQTELIEEIRDQFAEHLELQREILRLLMAERR